jgi:hypothetical protein
MIRFHASRLFIAVAVLAFVGVAQGAPPPPPNFKFTTFAVPGATTTILFSLNNSGAMVGTYYGVDGLNHGLLVSGGKTKTIDHPSAPGGTVLSAINSTGTIAGYYVDAVGEYFGFTYKNGIFTAVNPAGSLFTTVYGINDAGVVSGSLVDPISNLQRGYFGSPTTGYTILDVPGSNGSFSWGINNIGNVTMVWFDSAGLRHGSLYTAKTKKFQTLNVPGAKETLTRGINTNGDIVFVYKDAAGGFHGSLRTGGKYYAFNDPLQPNNTRGIGINDKRMLAGAIVDTSGNWTGLKITY